MEKNLYTRITMVINNNVKNIERDITRKIIFLLLIQIYEVYI
jgi:hypothetical protein